MNHHPSQEANETEIVIIGAGIFGLFNALQYAKRGLKVMLIDNVVEKKQNFKVGESFLVFTSSFLRTIGELDSFLQTSSFIKQGVWFTYGMEHASTFEDVTEWGVEADPQPPHYLYDLAPDKKWFRCMFLDMQIVRPDAEAVMQAAVRSHPNITFLDTARVKDVVIQDDDSLHNVMWINQKNQPGITRTRWILDCSGRNRMLAKKFNHAIEKVEMNDGFQTTALWAQFDGITDDLFDERWKFTHGDGHVTRRDLYTVHLWGKGYWIWIIRLSEGRISIGVTFDKRTLPPGKTPKEQFWNLIRLYPLLDNILSPEQMLEFHMYRDVQYMTDTFVSAKRYAMVGDAASIIDAYYSQGIALGLVSSWHIANIIEQDVRGHHLDEAYIDQMNRATRQDWHIIRNAIREKYSPAIADSRFFILSHVLDMAFFWTIGPTRAKLTDWLVETGGDTSKETPELRRKREYVQKHLYYSQASFLNKLSPETVQKIQRRLQAGIAERARWRLENGIQVPALKSILRLTAPTPALWSLPFIGGQSMTDISAQELVKPLHLRQDKTKSLLDYLPLSTWSRLNWVIRLRPFGLIFGFLFAYIYDWADTSFRKFKLEAFQRASPYRNEKIVH